MGLLSSTRKRKSSTGFRYFLKKPKTAFLEGALNLLLDLAPEEDDPGGGAPAPAPARGLAPAPAPAPPASGEEEEESTTTGTAGCSLIWETSLSFSTGGTHAAPCPSSCW